MQEEGAPEKIIRLILAYYDQTDALVRGETEQSTQFLIEEGIRQGFILSPALFKFVTDSILNDHG